MTKLTINALISCIDGKNSMLIGRNTPNTVLDIFSLIIYSPVSEFYPCQSCQGVQIRGNYNHQGSQHHLHWSFYSLPHNQSVIIVNTSYALFIHRETMGMG